ncbi:hypothetical protein L2E82_35254 [Cichorium intybus]|uniref:Uncharacterized protein n=1 Tax=Cichorium intybus TaxID=13427 RepID=A0ACB9BNG9_CICIN|nr:hypothetical protein L2E82_35254 [Cichorium intybus]
MPKKREKISTRAVDFTSARRGAAAGNLQFADFWYVYILIMGDYMYPEQYYEDYENPADTYYEDDCYNESPDDNGWRTEESSQPENSATWAQLWVFMYNNYHEQKDQADALLSLQASLDRLEESWKCSPPSPEPEVSDFYTDNNVCELASPEYVMEGHTPRESQETTERVENVVEEEVVGDNATSDSTAFDVFDVFENVNNVDLVMCESVPSSDDLIDEDVVEGAVSDSTDPSPTIPEIVESTNVFGEGGKDLVMGDFVPPSDQTSHPLLVPIHLLDDDQEVDADELIFENNKHDFITTHDPFMNGKLDISSADQSAPHSNSSVPSILSLCSKVQLNGTNYNDWIRNIKMALRYENKEYVLETELVDIDPETATPEEIALYQKHSDDVTKVACIMIATMNPELQRIYEDYWPFEMHKDLAEKFRKQERIERCEVVKDFTNSKPKDRESICTHVQRMQGYVERLRKLAMPVPEQLAANMTELHCMLRVAEDGMKGKSVPSVNKPVLAIGSGKGKKRKGPPKQNWREKVQVGSSSNGSRTKTSHIPCVANPDEANCFYCKEKGHWNRSFPKYLQDVKDGKVKPSTTGIYTISKNSPSSNSWVLDTGCGFHICSDLQGLKESREVEHDRLNLIMGNRRSSPITKIGVYSLVLSSDVSIELFNCCYSPEMARNIISFHALFRQGFQFSFDNKIGSISVFKNGILIFTAYPCDGVYETVECVDNLGHSVNYIDSTSGVEKACLSDDVCESCLLGKMTKSPFKGSFERGKGLLDIIHTDVCGPFRSTTKDGTRFYVTFTDDFSRYSYIYLIKHKSDTFEKFKEFKNEVENQLGRKIKMLRSDRGGEYLSIEFLDYLKEYGIVSQLTPPRTPQLNGVAERRNRTLLDMVRSMMSRASLPIYFWGYALETAAHILNLVPTKKVAKTPHEMWTGKVPSLAHIKVWGCEAFVRRETQDKLAERSERCFFLGYPKQSFGYIFYRPSEDVVFVARRAVIRERELIFKEDSGSTIDLEEIQESSDDATLGETSNQHEEEVPVGPTDVSLPLRRSGRVSMPPEFYGFHITSDADTFVSDRTLINLDEPSNYQEAVAGPKSAKWKEAMDSEIKSMYDNQVWNLVDNVPGRKTVGCKWIFKKKTDMDGKVHTFKARLVAKGFTQTPRVDYDETFSPIAKIKSIRIMLAIAAFHDYEIWQMDVKTAFLNGKLTEDVYMNQPEGFVDAKYPNKVCKLERSIYGLKQASRSWNLCFHEKVKEFGFSRSEDESCVYVKASGSIVTFLVLYVDDILLMGNDIPTLQGVKAWLGKCFAMKDLGEAAYILGIRILRDRKKRLIGLSQGTYLEKTQSPSTDEEIAEMSRVPYASAIGSIMYAMTCTRPDVAFALSMVSRYQGNPGRAHWIAVKNILKYLRRKNDMVLVLGGSDTLRVEGYTDASFQTDRDSGRSQSGWVFLLNGRAVTWKSSKQDTVADSTCESEYIAASEASKETAWLKNFIGDLGVVPSI